MPQKPQPEKSGSAEEGQKHNKTASAFRVLERFPNKLSRSGFPKRL